MTSTRREFIQTTTGGLAGIGLGALVTPACVSVPGSIPVMKQRILILGGTGFLGPALIESVRARGHELTLFNSGTTESRRLREGRPTVVPAEVEVLLGNRDPLMTADDRRLRGDPEAESKRDPNSPRGLTKLEGRSWDAVIDTSGYFPRLVAASAELLAPRVEQYVFISTISVYARNDQPGMDESAELLTLADPSSEEFGPNFENYGGGKALCEAAAEAALPGRTTNIRPGYIVGPRDTSARYAYWPWRVAQGGAMLVPGTPSDPVQLIDVRDLAEWIVHCIETRTMGDFNATGPSPPLTMSAMLAACAEGARVSSPPVFAEPAFLAEQGLHYPIWASPEGETAGFHRVSIAKAFAAGLRFRPHAETARDTLAWLRSLPEGLQARLVPVGLAAQEEEVLHRWRARQG
jgi:2'-hydroxyisoflavone reductase